MPDIQTVNVPVASGAIAYSLNPKFGFELIEFTLHLGSTPTTSQDFSVTKNADVGADYDTQIYKKDLSTITEDIYYSCLPEEIVGEAGDQIDFAFANADEVTYGLQIKYRRLT